VWVTTLFAALAGFMIIAPRFGILSRVRPESPGALEKVARDKLSGLGISYPVRHRVAKFGYDTPVLRQDFAAGALYFLYRSSPYPIIPRGVTTAVSRENPPTALPGMITTKWDCTGRLLYLEALPTDDYPTEGEVNSAELWPRLLAAAGLNASELQPAGTGWIQAPGWDARASWTGRFPDGRGTPIRVEAAAWRGRPVYFEVAPMQQGGSGLPAVVIFDQMAGRTWAAFLAVFTLSGVLAWRNVRLRRGDRRAALRVSILLFVAHSADGLQGRVTLQISQKPHSCFRLSHWPASLLSGFGRYTWLSSRMSAGVGRMLSCHGRGSYPGS
jgi:hypothetical protein